VLIVGIRLVRDQAFKTVDLFVKKLEELEEHAKTMTLLFPFITNGHLLFVMGTLIL